MRRTTPWQVAKCTIAYAIKNADKKKGAAQPLRFPSAGRSLNSRGFSNPRYFCPMGQKQSERLTLAAIAALNGEGSH